MYSTLRANDAADRGVSAPGTRGHKLVRATIVGGVSLAIAMGCIHASSQVLGFSRRPAQLSGLMRKYLSGTETEDLEGDSSSGHATGKAFLGSNFDLPAMSPLPVAGMDGDMADAFRDAVWTNASSEVHGSFSTHVEITSSSSMHSSGINPTSALANTDADALGPLAGGDPFNMSLGLGGTIEDAQSILQEAQDAAANKPTYADAQSEYYDSKTPIAGSWHWAACDRQGMYECQAHGTRKLQACCCRSGSAFVVHHYSSNLTKHGANGVMHGKFAASATWEGDLGGSTTEGNGTQSAVVEYTLGGQCTPKDQLDEVARAHLG